MADPRWRTITVSVVSIALFALIWLLGAMVFFTAPEGVWPAIIPAGLLAVTVAGIVLARRSSRGYLVLALAGIGSTVWVIPWVLDGGVFSTLILVAGLVVAISALVAWRLPRTRVHPAAVIAPSDRTYNERCLAWSLGIGGGLLLARAALELVDGLLELPGASEHWAGDVVMWLIFVLPIPICLGAVAVVAARTLTRRRIGTATAVASLTALVVGGLAGLALLSGRGGSVRPFDDPLFWPPIAALAGTAIGVIVAAVDHARALHTPRSPRAPHAPSPRPS